MFDDSFRVCFADTPFGLELHQRIRYQVFCLDKGFEDPGSFDKERETDAWDDHSAHFIIQDKRTRQWIAATRVVLPRKEIGLPVEEFSQSELLRPDDKGLELGEVSRFCLINSKTEPALMSVNVPAQDSLEAWGIGMVDPKKRFEVTLGLIRAIIIFTLKRNLPYCYMLVTDAFARLLRKLGVEVTQAGPAIDHRGMRTPYLIDMRKTVQSMTGKSKEVRALFGRAKHAYVRISSVVEDDEFDLISEYSPDHTLFNQTLFKETVLAPAEGDSNLNKRRKSPEPLS